MGVRMLIVEGRSRGKFLSLPRGEFVFGRGPECHVRPNSPWVSRQHCLVCISPEGVRVRDLGSSHGTLINGTRVVGEQALQVGDQLQVGPLVLQLVNDPAGEEAVSISETGILLSDTADMKMPEG